VLGATQTDDVKSIHIPSEQQATSWSSSVYLFLK